MAMPLALRRFTTDDLDRFPDDGNRYELLDGVLFVTPAPGLGHQIVATRLAALLHAFLAGEPGVFVAAPGVVEIQPGIRMEPDGLVARLPPAGAAWHHVREHWLAIEVSGRDSRVHDRENKRDAYLSIGVGEVWLVDLEDRRILVSRAGGPRDVAHVALLHWRPPVGTRQLAIDVAALFRNLPRER